MFPTSHRRTVPPLNANALSYDRTIVKQCVLLPLLLLACLVSAEEKGEPFVYTTSNTDIPNFGLWCEEGVSDTDNPWVIESEEPPISISVAVATVFEWASRFYISFDSIFIHDIVLQHNPCSMAKNQWLYRFDFLPIVDGKIIGDGDYLVAVTMSGMIIEPREYRN